MPVDQIIPLGTETRPEFAARMAQARGLMLLVRQSTGQMVLCSRKLPGWQRWIVALAQRTPEAA